MLWWPWSELKRNVTSAPIRFLRNKILAGTATDGDIVEIKTRADGSIFLRPHDGSLQVFFNVTTRDADDSVYTEVFLREFASLGKKSQFPTFSYRKEVPAAVTGVNPTTGEGYDWVTMVLTDRHLKAKDVEKNISLILSFRDYLQYHLKCSKAHLHTRMRTRVTQFLRILNRARPEFVSSGGSGTSVGYKRR